MPDQRKTGQQNGAMHHRHAFVVDRTMLLLPTCGTQHRRVEPAARCRGRATAAAASAARVGTERVARDAPRRRRARKPGAS